MVGEGMAGTFSFCTSYISASHKLHGRGLWTPRETGKISHCYCYR